MPPEKISPRNETGTLALSFTVPEFDNTKLIRAVFRAASSNNASMLEHLYKQYGKAVVRVTNNLGQTPLYWSVAFLQEKAIVWLLEHGADPNACMIEKEPLWTCLQAYNNDKTGKWRVLAQLMTFSAFVDYEFLCDHKAFLEKHIGKLLSFVMTSDIQGLQAYEQEADPMDLQKALLIAIGQGNRWMTHVLLAKHAYAPVGLSFFYYHFNESWQELKAELPEFAFSLTSINNLLLYYSVRYLAPSTVAGSMVPLGKFFRALFGKFAFEKDNKNTISVPSFDDCDLSSNCFALFEHSEWVHCFKLIRLITFGLPKNSDIYGRGKHTVEILLIIRTLFSLYRTDHQKKDSLYILPKELIVHIVALLLMAEMEQLYQSGGNTTHDVDADAAHKDDNNALAHVML